MKIFNPKNYTLLTKSLIIFLIIAILLILIRTFLSQPKIKEKNLRNVLNTITTDLINTKDLIKDSINTNINYKNISSELILNKIELLTSDTLIKDIIAKKILIKGDIILIWIINIPSKDSNKHLFLRYTINEKDIEIENSFDVLIQFLLKETLIAIVISFFLLLISLKKILDNIDKLTIKNARSLEEKEILLKEIHHRVKNNLAITISLLELQEEEIEDENTKKILKNVQERIFTMELLHRKLYESSNLSKIHFKSYIIDLVNKIKNSYDKENKVLINFNIENISLNIESAMPYGLILNELLTNCFKYAYEQNTNPQLEIEIFKNHKKNKIILIVKDNGKGLKQEFSKISHKTLGLRLINMIAKHQLMGEITYEYEDGAKFIIKGNIIS